MDDRLTLLAQMVRRCSTAADIGTDHGYLICHLVEQGIAANGIAADINPQPLQKARSLVVAHGLSERIECRCADGLTGIPPVDAVVIAGMGGELIAQIIDSWQHSRSGSTRFYLQPMTKAERLRAWLWEQGFATVSERCCVAAGRAYSAMEVVYTGLKIDWQPVDLYLGGIDPAAGEPEQRYCQKQRATLQKKLSGLESAEQHDATELGRYRQTLAELDRRMDK